MGGTSNNQHRTPNIQWENPHPSPLPADGRGRANNDFSFFKRCAVNDVQGDLLRAIELFHRGGEEGAPEEADAGEDDQHA